MIRLLAALGVFLFSAMWFLGGDQGQVTRDQTQHRQAAADQAPKPPVRRSVFIPAQPVMQAKPPSRQELVTEAAVRTAVLATPVEAAPVSAALPEPVITGGRLMRAPGGANVRSGPGKGFDVLTSLTAGDEVLVVDASSDPDWYLVRVEGDGATGWVSARLLRE